MVRKIKLKGLILWQENLMRMWAMRKRLTQEEIIKLPGGKRKYFNTTYTSTEENSLKLLMYTFTNRERKNQNAKRHTKTFVGCSF